ncbi:hypothetical protein [Streptomyces sp. NPDC059743]|uniref:hypothetical protein n=1 Tax=Streptomyces sp. NPDC059743 TaxID=3346928 RepID=UPI003663FF28
MKKRDAETAYVLTTYHAACDAYAWLEATVEEYPPVSTHLLPDELLAAARRRLDSGGEVDWFYYSSRRRYLTRTLEICHGSRPTERCSRPCICPQEP